MRIWLIAERRHWICNWGYLKCPLVSVRQRSWYMDEINCIVAHRLMLCSNQPIFYSVRLNQNIWQRFGVNVSMPVEFIHYWPLCSSINEMTQKIFIIMAPHQFSLIKGLMYVSEMIFKQHTQRFRIVLYRIGRLWCIGKKYVLTNI